MIGLWPKKTKELAEGGCLAPTISIVLLDFWVIDPKALVPATPVVIIMVASASTNTETFPRVALAPSSETSAPA